MSNIAIQVEHLYKQYKLGVVTTGTISHDLNRWFHKVRGKADPYEKITGLNDRTVKAQGDYVWALNDINFEVNKGDIIGIIGRNGAGKSTFLKILSKVTAPTKGAIKVNGRIASLLEVGTGFHPELSGRENIFLNGAVLGMTKLEIKSKLDEIIDFSGVEKYVDTPVKRYSSGMYVRLAFAVAAHLEPEILVVDEVLAVGDAEFQKKCLGKMKDVSGHGRTILFVSHNMATIQNLRTKSLVLQSGSIAMPLIKTENAISFYVRSSREKAQVAIAERKDRSGEGKIRIVDLKITNEKNETQGIIITGQEVSFKIYFEIKAEIEMASLAAALSITSSEGLLITVLNSEFTSEPFQISSKSGFIECKLNRFPLSQGEYSMNVILRHKNIIQDWIQEVVYISVEDGDYFKTGRTVASSHRSVLLEQSWSAGK